MFYGQNVEHDCGMEKLAEESDEGDWKVVFRRKPSGRGQQRAVGQTGSEVTIKVTVEGRGKVPKNTPKITSKRAESTPEQAESTSKPEGGTTAKKPKKEAKGKEPNSDAVKG